MVANTITLCRLLLTFAVIVLFGRHHTLDIGLIATIAIIFTLDGIDGYIARRRNETSKLGHRNSAKFLILSRIELSKTPFGFTLPRQDTSRYGCLSLL